jgi:hypothetical protein
MESISDISLLRDTTEAANDVQLAKRPVRSVIVTLAWVNALCSLVFAPTVASVATNDSLSPLFFLIALFGVVGPLWSPQVCKKSWSERGDVGKRARSHSHVTVRMNSWLGLPALSV